MIKVQEIKDQVDKSLTDESKPWTPIFALLESKTGVKRSYLFSGKFSVSHPRLNPYQSYANYNNPAVLMHLNDCGRMVTLLYFIRIVVTIRFSGNFSFYSSYDHYQVKENFYGSNMYLTLSIISTPTLSSILA